MQAEPLFLHIISREQARALGIKKYFNGEVCPNGGPQAIRYVAKGSCGCPSCSARISQRISRSHAMLRERLDEVYRAERIAEAARRRKALAVHEASREKKRKQKIAESHAVSAAKRRSRKLFALPTWNVEIDDLIFSEAVDLVRRRQQATGIAWHVDHMIPLQARNACGLHCAANLQVIPARLNLQKGNRMVLTQPYEWLMEI